MNSKKIVWKIVTIGNLQVVYPAGYYEEEASKELAEVAEIPLAIARAIIHAEGSEFEDFDDKLLLAKRIERASFIMRVLDQLYKTE